MVIPSLFRSAVRLTLLFLFFCACAPFTFPGCKAGSSSPSATKMPHIALEKVASGFTRPVHIAHGGDGSGRLFIVEQGGVIKIIKDGAVLPAPFLDITGLLKFIGAEQGLLSVAFPPGYGQTGKGHFFIYYTADQGIGDTVLARYDTSENPDAADPASGQILLTVVQPFTNHNGGQLAFGPDRFLFIGVGDGGSGGDSFGNAQNRDSLLGKILRIDVESQPGAYTTPADNPFIGTTGQRPEIWAYGLRNPWRFSFDRETGELYIADVGEANFEEVDVQPLASGGGKNYGWNVMEGLHCYVNQDCDQTGLTPPVAEYAHDAGNCSISGGFVYRGSEFPTLRGIYLYADFCTGRIWGLRRAGAAWENTLLLDTDFSIATFGEDEAGNVYVADYGGGDIYKITVPAQGL